MLDFRLRLSGRQRGDQQVVTRVLVMLALTDGYGIEETANLFKVSDQTVRNWLRCLFTAGVAGLVQIGTSPGRPAKLSKSQRRELGQLLDAGPTAAGFTGSCWRCPMVQALIEERFGVLYSVRYLSQLLRSMAYGAKTGTCIFKPLHDSKI